MKKKMILNKVNQLNRLMINHKEEGQMVLDNHLKAKVNWLQSFSQNRSCLKKAQKRFLLSKKVMGNKVLVLKVLLRREKRFKTQLYLRLCLINYLIIKIQMLSFSLKINLITNLMRICKFRVSKLLDCSLPLLSFIHIIS